MTAWIIRWSTSSSAVPAVWERRFAARGGSVKSSVSLEPETFDLRASRVRHAVGLRVHLQLLQVAGPCGVL